jgi:ferredoxin
MADLTQLREKVLEVLPQVDAVIGWKRGFDSLRAAPMYMRGEADVDKLIWDRTCMQNLATYLPHEKGRKIGVIVKGCDSRSVIQLLQEGLIDRKEIVLIGLPCDGIISIGKLKQKVDIDRIKSAVIGGGKVEVESPGESASIDLQELKPDKCLSCKYPNALIFDHFAGEPLETLPGGQDQYARIAAFEERSLEERFEFWKREMQRCIRCYACRNACPLCVCRDFCLAESRQPHYQSQESDVMQKWFFQMIHATHMAGRCTECGECERACPMGIPVLLFKKKLGSIMKDVFNYESGIDTSAVPPLQTYQAEEESIIEKEWL